MYHQFVVFSVAREVDRIPVYIVRMASVQESRQYSLSYNLQIAINRSADGCPRILAELRRRFGQAGFMWGAQRRTDKLCSKHRACPSFPADLPSHCLSKFQFRHSLLLNLSIASRLFVWHYFFPPPSSFKSNVPSKKITLNVMLKMAAVQHLCATLSNFNPSDVTSSPAARVQSLRTEKDTFAYVAESAPEDNSSREGASPSCS